jgi:hypothetical protein
MGNLNSIQSTQYAVLLVSRQSVPAVLSAANCRAAFATAADFVSIDNVRDMPTLGSQDNIIKVAQYNSKSTIQANVQGDLEAVDVVVNYDPSLWLVNGNSFATTGTLMDAVNDGTSKLFMVAMLSGLPPAYVTSASVPNIGGTLTNIVKNTQFYFVGRLEAITYTPMRDDVVTATINLSVQSDLIGPTSTNPGV